ncbi:hypothetical protein M9Y10_036305 [Tritrichomonas musculus]|uniref:Uncharacterized protein n=1 Tax=Tritrichomonas musculus TaxID=1915356 RepID=A0ABR2GWJ5_9EUKA
MIIVPSPELLIHKKSPYYDSQIYDHENDPIEEEVRLAQQSIDNVLVKFQHDDSFTRHSRVQVTYESMEFLSIPISKIALLMGALCSNMNKDNSALYWYKLAASRGSIRALIAIGILYLKGRLINIRQTAEKENINIIALKWFFRAMRRGSLEAIQYVAYTYYNLGKIHESFHYFFDHYIQSNSLYSKYAVANLLASFDHADESYHWLISSANQGHLLSARSAVSCQECNVYRAIWEQLISKFEIPELEHKVFNEDLFSIKDIQENEIPENPRLFDIFWQFDTIQSQADMNYFITPTRKYHIQKIERDEEILFSDMDERFGNLKVFEGDPCFYPSLNRTSYIIKAFKYAAPQMEKRNLKLALSFLRKGRINGQYLLSNCSLYSQKRNSKNPKDLVSCGLLASLLNQHEEAQLLFLKAGKKGNEQGCLLYGLYMFHSDNEESIQIGSSYLARCMSNPIALLHLGLANNDFFYLRRASEILKIEKNHEMFEWLGDCFKLGAIIPQNYKLALLWYGASLRYKEEEGEDPKCLLEKINLMKNVNTVMSFCF